LHFPSARAAQVLPGTLPYGARTFLGMVLQYQDHNATVQPTPPSCIIAQYPRLKHDVRYG